MNNDKMNKRQKIDNNRNKNKNPNQKIKQKSKKKMKMWKKILLGMVFILVILYCIVKQIFNKKNKDDKLLKERKK